MGANSSIPENTNVVKDKYKKDIDTLNKIVNYFKHDDLLELKKILMENNIIDLDKEAINNILNKYEDVFKILKSPDGSYMKDTDSIVYNFFKNDNTIVNKAKNTIDNSRNIDDKFKNGLVSLLENTNDLNKKYKYFQYKYIEMNLFFMAFVANIQTIIESYTTQVQFIEKAKFDELTKAIDSTFNSMQSVIQDGNKNDLEKFRDISKKFKDHVVKSHEKTIQSLDQKSKETFESLLENLQKNENIDSSTTPKTEQQSFVESKTIS